MPGFNKGVVPSPQYGEDANQFSQITEFTNDVYIYGTLYADIKASDLDFGQSVVFDNLTITKSFLNEGTSIFNDKVEINAPLDVEYLTVFHQHNVGAAGTVFVAISSTSDALGVTGGRVGIGTTQPDAIFQIGNGDETVVATDLGSVGIGTTQPVDKFQVNSVNTSFVVTGLGTVGIGTTSVGGDWTTEPYNANYDGATQGELKLDILGSVHIDRNIYDSQGSPGINGYYLQRDANGIRWNQVSPADLDGIRVQDNGVDLPIGGTSQLFSHLNFVQINSQGTGTDSLVPIPNTSNPTTIADIQTKSFWGFTSDEDIFRMSKVGINNNSPSAQLDITGTLHATGNVDFDANLNVDAATTLNSTLDVDGVATFNDSTDSSSTSTGSVQIDGGVGISKKLFVGNDTKIEGTTESSSKDTGALIVEGGVGIEKNLNVGGDTKINGTSSSTDKDTGSLIVEGGVGIEENINIGGSGVIAGRLDVDDGTQSDNTTSGALVVDGGVGIVKNLNVGQKAKITGNLELDARLIDFFNNNGVGVCKTDYRLSSFDVTGVGVGVSWRPSGVQTKRTIWVTKNGCDTNSGLLEGDAKYTIGAAAGVAQVGDTIRVRSGTYFENNPIGLREDVAINGEDLRLVLLIPENKNKDFFHVRRGCLIENLSFTGEAITDDHTSCAAVAFPPTQTDIDAGLEFQAVTGFTDVGPADEGSSGRWRSPYIRNCTNFMKNSIGMKINGDHANANNSGSNNLGQDLKSMVCDSFTQYNEAGIGVSLSNNAYAQLVSIFTICCDVGIAATSGGQCDLTNSNSSFGRIGLLADGFGDIEFDGTTLGAVIGGSDSVIVKDTRDFNTGSGGRRFRTSFDGQGAYFHLNMSNYPDSPSSVTVTKPLELVRSIKVINGGADGDYSAAAPPIVTLSEPPNGPESILPEFSPNVSVAGTITSVDIINSGRNFLPDQSLTVNISGGGSAQLQVDMDPILFTVSESTVTTTVNNDDGISGISTITFNEFIPYAIADDVKIELVRLSRIITSSHSFEYIGSGNDINTANPFQAGIPIPENEVVAINGGQVPFTSTDQKGNFRIGDGLTIDQTTSTIRGRDFNRAIQAQLTPLILALN
tara:strand:- start:3722 stop:7033 length:3312 start_codon:yes stop_codon:yes gene_type:complete